MKKLKIGLIGCCGMASVYRHIYTQIEGAELYFVVGLESDCPEKVAKELGCSRFSTDYMDLINSDVDIVDISTPNHLHRQQFVDAIKAGKHIFLQKPIAASIKDAFIILDEAEKSNKNIGMYMSRRSSMAYVEMKKIIRSGVIGNVSSVHARTALMRKAVENDAGNWRSSVEKTGGGSLIQLGIHDYDIIQWILDAKIVDVSAFCENIMSPHIGGDDTSQTLIKLSNDVVGCVETSYCSKESFLVIYGNKGRLLYKDGNLYINAELPYKGIFVDYEDVGQERFYPVSDAGKNLYRVDNPYEQHVLFVKSVIENKPVPVTIREGFESFMAVKAAYEASITGKTINISEFIKSARG